MVKVTNQLLVPIYRAAHGQKRSAKINKVLKKETEEAEIMNMNSEMMPRGNDIE